VSRFRRACRFLHRETGLLVFGLTVAYAISGVAVNHIDDWNPSYRYTAEPLAIDPGALEQVSTDSLAAVVCSRLALTEPVRHTWRPTPDRLDVITQAATYEVDLASGRVVRRSVRDRPFLRDVNFLHLNHGKGIWTWIADAYALGLLMLAATGIFLVGGRNGLAGRGGVWLMLGLVLPVGYLLLERYL
jgi:hypothetical protein